MRLTQLCSSEAAVLPDVSTVTGVLLTGAGGVTVTVGVPEVSMLAGDFLAATPCPLVRAEQDTRSADTSTPVAASATVYGSCAPD
jgi:hypothetical protein